MTLRDVNSSCSHFPSSLTGMYPRIPPVPYPTWRLLHVSNLGTPALATFKQ